jgi:BTB/POZ domain-containing protein 7
MIGDDRENLRANAWIRGGKNNGLFVRPRLFMPYYEEIKAQLDDHLVQEVQLLRLRRMPYSPDIPDTLYMVEDKPRPRGTAGVDVLAAALPGTLPCGFIRLHAEAWCHSMLCEI